MTRWQLGFLAKLKSRKYDRSSLDRRRFYFLEIHGFLGKCSKYKYPQLRSPSQLKIGSSQREIPSPPDQDQLVHPPLLRYPVKVSTLPWRKHLDEVNLKWIR